MGTGIDAAKSVAPEHAAMIDNMKDQLLIVLFKRLGGEVEIPVAEIDDTGMDTLSFSVDFDKRVFRFVVGKKQ